MPQRTTTVMKALVYRGPGVIDWADVALPKMHDSRDAIVRVDAVTICGTDLHILKGRLAGGRVRSDPRTRGRRHISGCGRCRFCGTGPYGQCLDAGGLVDTYSTPTLMSMLAAGQLDTASTSPIISRWIR